MLRQLKVIITVVLFIVALISGGTLFVLACADEIHDFATYFEWLVTSALTLGASVLMLKLLAKIGD